MKTNAGLVVSLLLSLAGCVPGNSPIRVLGTFPLDPAATDCSALKVAVAKGRLDLAGAGSYFTVVSLDNELIERPVKDNRGNAVTSPGSTNFISESMYLTYTSTPPLAFKAENVPYSGVLKPDTTDNQWGVNLIGPEALKTMLAGVVEETTLLATFEFRGHLESGNRISSNAYTFPIIVTPTTAAPCDAPNFLAPTGPCRTGGGQDGSTVYCCMPGDANALCTAAP